MDREIIECEVLAGASPRQAELTKILHEYNMNSKVGDGVYFVNYETGGVDMFVVDGERTGHSGSRRVWY